jgi:hypothetical protein
MTRRIPALPVVWVAGAAFLALFAGLAMQLRHGHDPVLGAGRTEAAAAVVPRRVLVRRIVERRVIVRVIPAPTAPAAPSAAGAPTATSVPWSTSSAAQALGPAPAPAPVAPAPAPAAPPVTRSS